MTTAYGIQYGMTEGNPLAHWFIGKVGQAFTAFIFMGAFCWVAGLAFGLISMTYGCAFAGGITALETWMTIRNHSIYTKLYQYIHRAK